MTLIQHKDEQVRFQQQVENAREYVLPFIEKELRITADTAVLDIGCGDGGVLLPFLQKGCTCTGIELDRQKSEFATQFLSDFVSNGKVEIVNQNIYEEKALERFAGRFDLIILKDVIEHIPDQERFIPYLKKFLRRIRWKPRKLAVFAGRIDYPSLGFFDRTMIRFIMWMTRGPTDPTAVVEFTDWSRVEAFGEEVARSV